MFDTSELVNHEIGYFHEPRRKSKAREWVEGIIGMAAVIGFVCGLIVLASK